MAPAQTILQFVQLFDDLVMFQVRHWFGSIPRPKNTMVDPFAQSIKCPLIIRCFTWTFFQFEGIDECSLIVPSNESAKRAVAPPCSDQMCSSMLDLLVKDFRKISSGNIWSTSAIKYTSGIGQHHCPG
ncbi:hypothetical protein RHMOL_Rhmol13G0088000 [Rhododendron molle]|uniref:Uncharacterized protein n=1 Tax=Rhododendron molle TaxID=49168 RepID=A0ACC0L5K7_RHOML|nr:hypothetical protein RHMOL_Rhmol13G0088000 [Rhododendron molle]